MQLDCCVTNQTNLCYQCDKPICEVHRGRHPGKKALHPIYVCPECLYDITKGKYGDRKVLRSKKIS